MSNKIKLKRGTSTPTTSDIVDGEVAIDKSAQKLYVNDGGTIKEIGGGSSSGVADGAITTAKLADDAVTTAKLAADAVTASELSNNIVDDNKLTANAVITSKIADDAVTYAKIQNVSATDRILGRDSSGAGSIEEITPANVRTMLNVEDGATADQSASEILTAIKTVDGASSGLDSDLLDGQHGSHYLDYNNFSNTPTIPTNNNQLSNGAGYITSATNNFVSSASFSGGTLTLGRSGLSNLTVSGIGTSTFSGSYNDLSNKPTIPTNNNQLTNGAGYITSQQTNASNLSSGTLNTARLPTTIDIGSSGTFIGKNFHSKSASSGTLTTGGWSAFHNVGFEAITIVKTGSGYGTALFINIQSSSVNFLEFQNNNAGAGGISKSGSGVSYNTGSDYRLKKDISSITDATAKIKTLNPVNFKWNNTEDDQFVSGFIAHEVQETGHFNFLVTGTKDGVRNKYDKPEEQEPDYQTVDYGKFTPMLIAAFKELESRVTALESS